MYRLFLIGLLLLILFSMGCENSDFSEQSFSPPLPEKIDFNYHIRPLLSDRCFSCHGPDAAARKADLRLDNPASAYAKLESGKKAFAPGKLQKSEAWHRIYSEDPDYQMPPPESNLSLTEREKALITKWIKEGAEYQPHWAFIPPQKSKVPSIDQPEYAQNEIDHFILETLHENDLSLSPEAYMSRLIRRVSFDLTGLPPSQEEINQFFNDSSEKAYEKVVDRLLASDAFAERMCMDWLDVARYADSHGLHSDGWRSMYPWRDWVIKAFQQNMPFDQFLTWQLAGDLMEEPNEDQLIATAFNRNHKTTAEGGAVDEEYRMEYVHDRVSTTATAFMGLTLECARCHDHKYDPISQREYYQFAAFFNQVDELGLTGDDGNAGPNLLIPSPRDKELLQSIQSEIEEKRKQLILSEQELAAQVDFISQLKKGKLPRDTKQEVYLPFDEIKSEQVDRNPQVSAAKGVEIIEDPKRGKVVSLDQEYEYITLQKIGLFEQNQSFAASIWVNPNGRRSSQTLVGNSGPKGVFWRGWDFILDSLNRVSLRLIHALPHDVIQVVTEESIPSREWSHLAFSYDGSGKSSGISLFLNGKKAPSFVKYDRLYRSIYPIKFNKEKTDKPLRMGKSYRAFTGEYGIFEGLMDDFYLFGREMGEEEIEELAGGKSPANSMKATLYETWRNRHVHPIEKEIQQLREQEITLWASAPEVMVMKEIKEPRPTFILNRGNYDQPGEQVYPNTPVFLPPFPENYPQNRLGLAQWMTSPDHPLTSRIVVNRLWQMFFGQGLVDPPHDFGLQGNLPTHPKLLDWLAVKLVESDWNLRAVIRLIVTSATYRQTSNVSPEVRQKDPDNLLLSRGPSYRLPAEMIRDHALTVSGLLDSTIGGPSVKPIQPEGLWKEKTSSTHILREYVPDSGSAMYRRSMYTFVRRTSPHPAMRAFDAPNRSVCTVKRSLTNTPMQALVLLNDPEFIEASRNLAEEVLNTEYSLQGKIVHVFDLMMGYAPSSAQAYELRQLFEEEKDRFSRYPASAKSIFPLVNIHLTQVWHLRICSHDGGSQYFNEF
ncbi:MAG: DUF1553 domain-containing protein [Bacteroidia bacterium]